MKAISSPLFQFNAVYNPTMPDVETLPKPMCVAAMYVFTSIAIEEDHLHIVADRIRSCMRDHGIRGTLILASEGINGTVAGAQSDIDGLVAFLRSSDVAAGAFMALSVSLSYCDQIPFQRALVKVRPEIVTMRRPQADPIERVGEYVDPAEWNSLVDDPEVLLIDTRNDFEVRMGTFVSFDGRRATNPETTSFTDFPAFVDRDLAGSRDRTVAMFCTGGIRCEKATSYLLAEGFQNVRHLRGGILSYLREQPPGPRSRWQGECFVFDDRVALGHGLVPRAGR